MRATGARDRRVQGVAGVVFTAAHVAVPDWVEDPRRQRRVRWAVRGSGLAYGVWSVRAARAAEAEDGAEDGDRGRAFWSGYLAAAAVVVPTVLAVDRGARALDARMVRALKRRGVARPWTWVAVGTGVASLAVDVLATRWADQHGGTGGS